MLDTLDERIAFYRKKCGLTQEELAEKCSVTPQAVSKWENAITSPDISLLPRLSEVFGVSCDELLGARKPETVAVAQNEFDPSRAVLKIRVVTDEARVNLNLPLEIVKLLLASGAIEAIDLVEDESLKGAKSALENIDLDRVIALANAGVMGKLVEIEVDEENTKVEIWVE